MAMTSKQRARVALEGGIPDMVPLGDFSIDADTVERIVGHPTYVRAKARCQIAYWEGRRDEVVQNLIEDTIALFRKLDCYDIINLCAMTLGLVPPAGYQPEAPRRVDDVTWEYADGRVLRYSEITADLTLVHDPQEWTRPYSPEDYPLEWQAKAPDPSVFELVDAVVEEFGEERFIIGPYPLAAEWVQLGTMQRTLLEMAERPDLVERAARSSMALAAAQQRAWPARPFDAVMDGTDFAYKSGTFMSPQAWWRICHPPLAANVQAAHDAGLLFVQHACGNNQRILDGFLQAGIDAYQSIQASAGMDLAQVKEQARGRMAVWGGVPVEHLVDGTPDQVRRDVRDAVARAKPGGAFVMGSTHSIAIGTKYDCFMAMLDEFEKLRDY